MDDFFDGMPLPPDPRGDFSGGIQPPTPDHIFVGYSQIGDGRVYVGLWINPELPIELDEKEDYFTEAGQRLEEAYDEIGTAFTLFDPFRTLSDFTSDKIRGNAFPSIIDAYYYITDRGLDHLAVIVKSGEFYYVVINRNS